MLYKIQYWLEDENKKIIHVIQNKLFIHACIHTRYTTVYIHTFPSGAVPYRDHAMLSIPAFSTSFSSSSLALLRRKRFNIRTYCCDSGPPATPVVRFRGREIQAKHNEKLRAVLLRTDRKHLTPHNGAANLINCRGLGTCGTCAVVLLKGQVEPQQRSIRETLRLSFPPHDIKRAEMNNLRLACQVRVLEDIEIRKNDMFWGQGQQEQPFNEIKNEDG